jgi:hypothetical protein
MFRRARGHAFSDFLDGLSDGDPVAIAIAIGVALLAAFVVGVYLYDRKRQAAERKKSGSGRK